jgi:transposase
VRNKKAIFDEQMEIKASVQRDQISFGSIEDSIEKDNPVRVIEAFVEHINLKELGFEIGEEKTEGRPSYNAKVFLKLYFYGYLNGLRSSRKLAKECARNIEVQWLLCKLMPNYHSISDFRKNNPKALRNTFKLFVLFLKDADLVSGDLVAIDGTKVRANNSKKNNFSVSKIDRHIEYIENKTNEYLAQLDQNDTQEEPLKINNVSEKIARLAGNKIKYELLKEKLIESNDTQISTTDADARALLVQGQVVEVSYNMQAAVDAKYNLPIATHTINKNDRKALTNIALEAKANLGAETFTALVDKGYHNGGQLQTCKDNNITTICAYPELVNSNAKGTTPEYMVDKFVYNETNDTYTCPQGETLTTTGTWHKKTRERDNYLFKKYRTQKCKTCPVKHLCTGKEKGGREIDRSQYAQAVHENNQRYKDNQQLYRQRQEINEHIFGTIKRQWGFNHTNLRGLEKVNGEHSLIMTVYNLKRSMNILGIENMIEKIKKWKPNYKAIVWLCIKWQNLRYFKAIQAPKIFEYKIAA